MMIRLLMFSLRAPVKWQTHTGSLFAANGCRLQISLSAAKLAKSTAGPGAVAVAAIAAATADDDDEEIWFACLLLLAQICIAPQSITTSSWTAATTSLLTSLRIT